jgi:hypothetical protein
MNSCLRRCPLYSGCVSLDDKSPFHLLTRFWAKSSCSDDQARQSLPAIQLPAQSCRALGLHYALAVAINSKTNKNKDEPRWLVLVATLAAALIYAALPSNLSMGPRWLLLAVMVAVVIPTLISHRAGHHTADKMLGYLGTGILTIAMIWSPEITREVYLHSLPAGAREAVEKVEALLIGPNRTQIEETQNLATTVIQ